MTGEYLSFFSDRFIVSSGTMGSGPPMSGGGLLKKGLKVVVILSGSETIDIEGHATLDVTGPQSCVILNEQDHNRVHWVAPEPLRFVLVQVDTGLACDELDLDLSQILKRTTDSGKPLIHVHVNGGVVQSIASQIFTCGMQGDMRRMYLAGKGLELVASAMSPLMSAIADDHVRLSAAELKSVTAVYDRLVASLDHPPSLPELAREAGMSTTKLTQCFRRTFGKSVFSVLQEHRLQEAHRLLASGEITVSQAAYKVGYSPAHFATIFRRRFGVVPSKLS